MKIIIENKKGKTENLVNTKKKKKKDYFRLNCDLDIFLRYSPCNEYLCILGYTNE